LYDILIELGEPMELVRLIKMCLNEMYSEFNFRNAIRKFQENKAGLKLNITHQLLVHADDGNLLGNKR
jgi:hypothetical protein